MSEHLLDLLCKYPLTSPRQAVALQKSLDFLVSMKRLEATAGVTSESLKDVSDALLRMAEGDMPDEPQK